MGEHSRFAAIDPDQLADRLAYTVCEETAEEGSGEVDSVAITGDISEASRPSEYDQAERFLARLATRLQLPRNRFFFVPGNHDVSWQETEHVEIDQNHEKFDSAEFRRQINDRKFRNYDGFLSRFYDGTLPTVLIDEPFLKLYDAPELDAEIAALNSCQLESHRAADHLGHLSQDQIKPLSAYWTGPPRHALRLVLIHHNPVPNVSQDIETWRQYLEAQVDSGAITGALISRFIADAVGLTGRDDLRNLAEDCQVTVILHGHHHRAEQDMWCWRRGEPGGTYVLSAGSLSLNAGRLPKDQPNTAQIVWLNTASSSLFVRLLVFDPRAKPRGGVGAGHFVRDAAMPLGVRQKITLPRPTGSPLTVTATALIAEAPGGAPSFIAPSRDTA